MESLSAKTKLQEEVTEKGYLHIRFPYKESLDQILGSLGEVIQKTEIRENLKSTRLLVSNQSMGFHTDHHTAKYIAWFCNSQSSTGGHSLLIDSFNILENFSESSLQLLQEITVKTHQVFYGDKLSIPLLSLEDDNKVEAVYYASWLVNTPGCIKHQKALEKFEEEIKSATPIKLLLSEGDLLIIDNHRMLHGREGFPSKSDRWLTRYWLS